MKENIHVRQIPGEKKRRWFHSREFDLIVWLEDDETPAGFELCYDKPRQQRSLRWLPQSGFSHTTVDDGEGRPLRHKGSPILQQEVRVDVAGLHAAFAGESALLPREIADYVLRTLAQHPHYEMTPC